MVNNTVKVAIPIFNAAFPGCRAVFAFDNASNHFSYAADALRVGNMNLYPEGKQGKLREATTHNRPGCNSEGGCCARRGLEAERDFQDQKGRLQEEVED